METAGIAILGTAIVASSAAAVAAAIDRFRKVAASITALVAGLAPWVFFLSWHNYIPNSPAVSVVGIFGSGPLFLVAFFLYGIGQRTPRRREAAGASLVGMFAGGGFSILLFGLLSRME